MAGHADFAGTACRVGGREHLAAQQAKEAAGALGAPARPFSRASLYESYLRGIPPRSTDAHCKVATHCFLPSSPCSLFHQKSPIADCRPQWGFFGEKRFAPRCFHALLNALSSPRGALTAVFGMGTGVSPPPVARTKGIGSGRLDPGNGAVRAMQQSYRPRTGPLGAAIPPPSRCPPAPSPPGGGSRAGGVQTSRPIRSGMVNASRRLRIRPVKRVFFPRPSGTCVRDG